MSLPAKTKHVKIKNMKLDEEFESRPHKAVAFHVETDKELQDVREVKCQQRFSGGKIPVKSKVEGGKANGAEDELW